MPDKDLETLLEKNLEALKESVLPAFIERVRAAQRPDWLEVIRSRDGKENLLITEGSRKTTAWNMDDTMERIRAQAEAIPTKDQDVSVLAGIGLGYLLNELVQKKDRHKDHKTVVIEPELWLIREALSRFDFSDGLKKKTIFVAADLADISVLLSILDLSFIVESYTMSIEEYANTKHSTYSKYIDHAANLVNQMRCNTGTVMNAGAIIADNDIANLPYVIQHRGVNELKDLFKGRPCVLVSTGPSLKKNIHLLREAQGRVVIVAVAQALRVLQAYDIRPDFITTVDFGEVNMVHLKGLMDSDVPLICLNKTYAPLLHAYRGPRFIVASPNPGYEDKAHGILTGKGALDSGGSVAHMNFSAACLMGCDPIIVVGQDLALSGGESHIALADAGGRVEVSANGVIMWKVRDQRCHLKDIEEGAFSMGFEHRVEGYFGEPVLTNIGLASFLSVFDSMFLAQKGTRTIINATQGGARIKGAHQMSLSSALAKHAPGDIDKALPERLLRLADDGDALIDKVIPMLEDDIAVLRDIFKHTQQGLRSNRKMLVTKHWDLVKKLMASNEYHSNKAHELSKDLPLIALAIFGASRRIEYSDLKVEGNMTHLEGSRKDFETRVRRNRLILEAAMNSAKSLKDTYEKTLERLKKYKAGNRDILRPQVPDERPSLEDAEQYFAEGNWARPLIIARKLFESLGGTALSKANEGLLYPVTSTICKALAMRDAAMAEAEKIDENALIEANELLYDAQRLGREEKDFEAALEMLERANELNPKNETVLWGLATTYHHTDRVQDALDAYRRLLETVSPASSIRYRFEYGQVLIKAGEIEDGLKQIQAAMEGTDEFDSFLWVVGDICRQAGLLEKALLAYDTYLEKFPADYKIIEKKADVLERLGRTAEAGALMEQALEISG